MARIEREFGREIPLGRLLQARSVREFAPALSAYDSGSIPPLQAIQPRGSCAPLYCVHPGSGNILCYQELGAALGPNRPVFGFQDPNQRRDDYRHSTVEGLAAIYIDALRQAQPHGPYHLLGWSFGGHVAFEMACCLERQGERVDLLAILDTWAAPQVRLQTLDTSTAFLLEIIGRDLGLDVSREQLRDLPIAAQMDYVIGIARQAGLRQEIDERRFLQRNIRIFRARLRAAWEYRPGPYAGAVTLFRAADEHAELSSLTDGETFGWRELAQGGVDVHDVPGSHVSMARSPNVQMLAEKLGAAIDRVMPAYVS